VRASQGTGGMLPRIHCVLRGAPFRAQAGLAGMVCVCLCVCVCVCVPMLVCEQMEQGVCMCVCVCVCVCMCNSIKLRMLNVAKKCPAKAACHT